MFVCQKIIIFIIRMSVLTLSCMLFLLCSTCSIFITLQILKFCVLISVVIVFWLDWSITSLITCLIMIVKCVLIMQIFNFKAAVQSVFFIMWFFISAEFNISTMFSLSSFLAVIIFFLLLSLIFVFMIFMIFADLIFFLLKDKHSCCRIVISCLICLNTVLIIKFDLIFNISA